jgi:hypothetical protein
VALSDQSVADADLEVREMLAEAVEAATELAHRRGIADHLQQLLDLVRSL